MAAKIFRINYKSDFILTMNSDAGWAIPFCIKFFTSVPSRAYFVGFDGTTYTHCTYDPSEPTKLVVQFDDHHLPIGDLNYQIAYHFTVSDFPNDTEDEVINPAAITTEIDGETYHVMLDFTGETAPEIEFSLPAYANEAERIQNELQRQQNEAERIQNELQRQQNEADRIEAELQREQATAAAVEGAENVNAQLNGTTLTVTNRQGVSTSVNTKGEPGERGPVGPEGPQGETGISIVSFLPKSETATTLIYTITFSNGHTQDVAIPKGPKGDTGATGPTGPQGPQGDTGVSITGFVETGETETATLYTITFSNSTTQQVAIPKGEKGERGLPGESGVTGDVSAFTVRQTIDPSATYGPTDIAGAATVQATNQELTELSGELTSSEQELISIVEQAYFTASSPTITTYSLGFQVLYIPVKQEQKLHITATNSDGKAFNYGFTSNLPVVGESVSDAVSVNTDNIDLTLVASADGYFVIAKYRNYFTNLSIETEESIFEKIIKDVNFSVSYLDKEAIYSKQSPLNFTEYHIIKGAYDINSGADSTGSYYSHNNRSCTKDYIPVKKLSRIQAVMATGFQVNVIFYKIQADGTISYIKTISSNNRYVLNTAVPIDADVAKLSFYPIGDREKVEITDVTTSNFNITMTVGNIVTKQEVHFVLPDNSSLFKINNNGGWSQGGVSMTAIETTRISNAYPINVIPGHRYTIEATPQNMSNLVIRAAKSSFVSDPDMITLPDVFVNRTTINTHQMTVIIPKGYEYIWMTIVPSATNITPENGETMDFRVIDVSGDLSKMQRARKIADLHTQGQTQVVIDGVTMTKYSQGMACDGGYLFQGYSTGEVEVYDLNTMEYVSTFVIHYGYHLGQITFGEKADETDEFRTLWTDDSGSIYGYKITRNGNTFAATLIKTITVPTKTGNIMQSYTLDFTNKKVVLYGYLGNTNASVEMTLYSISDFEDDATFTEESSIIYPHFGCWPFQSGLFRDGKLYMLTGTHQQNARIYCFDFSIGDAVNVLDLRREAFSIPMEEEPQGIDVYNGSILFSGSYSIYELFL